MGAQATLKLLLLGEDRSAGRAMRGLGKDADRTSGKLGRVAKVAGTALAGGLVVAGAAMVKLSKAAADDERAAVRLETSLKNSAGATVAQVAATEDWITALGKSTGVTDDELRPAVGRLALATKDLGKAQSLTRLAMDVSAGSGKSLEAVTTALAKAQNGNVAGLGRLGIATKNADGSTKSLKQITADLAKLYQGQAAKAAETNAGKQKILTTRMDELGETLGAKVQPLMLKATDAALKLVDGFEDGTGAGGEIRDVLEDVAAAGKAVAGAIDSIPGPVKKYGAELAIALVVMSKMRTMTGPLSAGLSTMVTNFRSAETRTAGLTKGLRGLGSGLTNVAGAGGMLLLADGANEAGTSMGALKSAAGGALSGAALGAFAGPVGAAIGAGVGGLAGGLLSLAGAGRKAEASATPLAAAFTNLATSLTGVNAALSENSRAAVFADLGQNGLLKTTRELGIADRTAVNAALGKRDAIAALSTQISRETVEQRAARLETMRNTVSVEQYKGMIRQAKAEVAAGTLITNDQRASLIKVRGSMRATRLETLKNNVAIAGSTGELKKAQAALRAFMKEPADKQIKIGIEMAQQFKDFQSTIFGKPPGRASGGPVTAGQPYIVGEHRPELFVPNQSGTILPRVPAMSGGPAASGGSTAPIVVQLVLDGKVIHQALLKEKRNGGGRSMGLA